jgi:hypothetical protein
MTVISPFNDINFSAYCRKAEVAPPCYAVKKNVAIKLAGLYADQVVNVTS